ncbi:MAG: SH3 domain-containing protein [Thermodesulfobacteriota bacterium]|nr:SH3 domain-containing protein [Thermodesulfobacteriota bacterium]
MTLFFVIALATVFYIGPLYLPAWFTWEDVVATAISPFSYEQAKALFLLLCFLSVCILYYRRQRRNKTIFRVPKKGEKGRLRLPDRKRDSGSVNMAIVLIVLVLVFVVTGYSQAFGGGRMVSIAREIVNMRSGPATSYEVLWKLGKGYPLQVVGSRKDWYKVQDFEGDSGWIHKRLVSRTPHVVVKKKIINIRSRPGTQHELIAKAKRGTVFQTIASVKGWVKVRHRGGITGWIARRLVWGW